MSGARVVKGWCPVHDRVVKSPNGLCPDCGRPLVALGRKPGPERVTIVEEEPDAEPIAADTADRTPIEPPKGVELGPWALAAIVTGIVLIAFFSGISVSRVRKPPSTTSAVPQAREEFAVRGTRRGAGVTLELHSFSQRGRRVVMRFSVPNDQPVESGRVGRAEVEFLLAGGSRNAIVELPTRSTVSGFIIDGEVLERPDIPIYGVKVNSLTLSNVDGELVGVDLSRVWRAGASGPTSAVTNIARRVGSRTFRLKGLVGWSDRIEARFEVAGEKPGWHFDDSFDLIIAGQPALEGSVVPSDRPGVVHVVFEGPSHGRPEASILIGHETLTVVGDWLWTFEPDNFGRR